MVEETISVDELVYDFPGRWVTLKHNGRIVKELETFGLKPFDVGDVEIEIREKFVHIRGDLSVTVSFHEYQDGDEVYRENESIEEVSS